MALTIEQFVESLIDSGLMSADEIDAFRSSLPANKNPQDPEALNRELVRRHKLTEFQACAIYDGKTQGLMFGNYLVLDKIGEGGMGLVFKAKHRRMDRIVALKVLPAAFTNDTSRLKRFQREVQVAAKLSHQNIVAAYDADEAHGVHFLVTEYVDGCDLAVLVKKNGPLAVETAVRCIIQAARGIEHAHALGIVHRDIKPSNLLLDNNGVVKILDMGLARLEPGVSSEDDNESLTQSGSILGTVDFMSPEQALNTKNADRRADIYSLGCTLCYLLTGKATYGGKTVMEKLVAHREHPVPELRAVRADIPEAVDAVFQRMIAKHVEERHQSVGELLADLEPLIDTSEIDEGRFVTGLTLDGSSVSSSRDITHQGTARIGGSQATAADHSSDGPTDEHTQAFSQPASPALRNKKTVLMVGALGVLALLGLSITVTAIVLSDGSADIEGKPPATSGRQPSTPNAVERELSSDIPSVDVDRRAAAWVLDIGGTLEISVDAVLREVKAKSDLPQDTFRITGIRLNQESQVTDTDLSHLNGLTRLRSLRLGRTDVSNAGLAHLVSLTGLQHLDLERTLVTDEGLIHLKGLTNLRHLDLEKTELTDAGLQYLQRLNRLAHLNIEKTSVTDEGLVFLKGLNSLQYLDIEKTSVTDAGLDHLASLIHLRELHLNGPDISEAGIAKLQISLPQLKIMH